MSDPSLFAASVPTEGTGANPFEWLLDLEIGDPTPAWVNCPDVDNLNPTFPPLTKTRSSYATKGRTINNKFGETCTLVFDAEKVRDNTGAIAQGWLKALLKASHGEDAANRVNARFYDALDPSADAEAYQAIFSVDSMARKSTANTGTEGEWYTVTLTSYSDVEQITTPVVNSIATITSALPDGQAAGEVVTLVGTGFASASAITVGGVAAPLFDIVSDTKIYVTLPAGTAGSAPIIVTNPAGASAAKAYTRA